MNDHGWHWYVWNQFSDTWPRTGEDACWSGDHSAPGDNCGTISAWDTTLTDTQTGVSVRHLYCVNVVGNRGDSGGPMYRLYSNDHVRAMALTSMINDYLGTCGNHIAWVQSTMDATLATSYGTPAG